MNILAQHILIELMECDYDLDSVQQIEQDMKEASLKANSTIVQSVFHHFSPYGVSGVIIIAESHLTIHTFPELEYAAIDIFTCSEKMNPQNALDYLTCKFKAKKSNVRYIQRGLI